MEHVPHLQRMKNEAWRGSPEHAALDAAIAALSAPPPAEPTNRAESSSKLVDGQPPAEAQPDRMAIKLLVAAGFVTEAKANEALNIAHGFDKGPLEPAEAQPVAESPITARRPTCEFPHYLLPVPASCAVCEGEINPPPSAPVGAQGFVAWFNNCGVQDRPPSQLARAAWEAALAQQPAAVDEAMRKVAAIAHSGGLIDMSLHDALTAIRRLSLPYWGKEEKPEQVHAALAQQGGEK